MKTVIMHKYYDPDHLFGGYGWSERKVWNDWNHIYSDPYEVEIPDDFYLAETVDGREIFFKVGCNKGYDLTIGNRDCENSSPYFVGGCPVESIKLLVKGKVYVEEYENEKKSR